MSFRIFSDQILGVFTFKDVVLSGSGVVQGQHLGKVCSSAERKADHLAVSRGINFSNVVKFSKSELLNGNPGSF